MRRVALALCTVLAPLAAAPVIAAPDTVGSATAIPATAVQAVPAQVAAGERIYREGRLPSGAPVRAERAGGLTLEGGAAACVNCHRRSGLGSFEGAVLIPPVIGPYLFRDRETNIRDRTLPHLPGYTPNLRAYDEQTLARALRTGHAPGERTLALLMPRYALDDAAIAALVAYLRQLSSGPSPGVGDGQLQFATVVTPDTAPADRAAMLGVMERYFAWRNERIAARVQDDAASAEGGYRTSRTWRLHVWELTGDPANWQRQLHERQASEPVFAVLSGLGGATWSPVHRFCEQDHVPCLLPNTDLPPVAEQDFYPLYYSRGVLLEADLIAAALAGQGAPVPGARVIQLYREGDIGAPAASALADALRAQGRVVVNRLVGDARPGALAAALQGVGSGDSLILWLRPRDLATLAGRAPTTQVFLSGLMADLESAPLPEGWRQDARMSYPFDLPDLRRVRMNFPHAWLRARGLALVNDRLQTHTWLACAILDEVVDSMLDSYLADFLVERYELMLGPRLSNGYFPRLGLAAGQRFASKGGYMVRFTGPGHRQIAAEGGWQTP